MTDPVIPSYFGMISEFTKPHPAKVPHIHLQTAENSRMQVPSCKTANSLCRNLNQGAPSDAEHVQKLSRHAGTMLPQMG
jgi:hypothetical protein